MKFKYLILLFLFFLALKFLGFYLDRDHFKIEFLDVGQGDAILITTPSNNKILVDGGRGNEVDYKLSQREFFNCDLKMLITTHMDVDHIGGLPKVLQRCSIDTVTFNDIACSSQTCLNFKSLTEKFNVIKVFKDDEFFIDGVYIKVLWPTKTSSVSSSFSINDNSTVLFVSYRGFEALLLGDAESLAQSNIDFIGLKGTIYDKLDVYKVSHHGSENGLFKPLFDRFKFNYCVVSVGENSYGHPSPTVLKFLENEDCKVYRTDLQGDIKFESIYN